MNTTLYDLNPTVSFDGRSPQRYDNELIGAYHRLLSGHRLSWTSHQSYVRLLGKGGQGVVYLSERRGAEGFTLPIALKIFSPERFEDARSYDAAMYRIAQVAARVALIQQDNLLDVQDLYDRDHIRMMVMEWVDGYDLRHLLGRRMLADIRERVSNRRWEQLNHVVITRGETQSRLKPGVAMHIVRQCLAALAALHRDDIVHGDIKPANIMLKRTGDAKIIDIGSAVALDDPPPSRSCTPNYVAPEVLDGKATTPRSDLASLGYVLIELLAGRPPFREVTDYKSLYEAKLNLASKLDEILPVEVARNELLMQFCRGLIAADPEKRFPTAEAADLQDVGAAAFQRQLIKVDMASEYTNDIRVWLEEVHDSIEENRRRT